MSGASSSALIDCSGSQINFNRVPLGRREIQASSFLEKRVLDDADRVERGKKSIRARRYSVI